MKDKCESCGRDEVIRIVYGYPLGEDIEQSEAGEIALGGCVVQADAPTHLCRACGRQSGRLADDGESLGGVAFVSFPEEPEEGRT